MQQQTASPFKLLKIIHMALVSGLAMFLLIATVLGKVNSPEAVDRDLETILQAIAAVLSITMLLTGYNIFKKRLAEVHKSQAPAEERFNQYRGSCILWWAMLEAPGLFSVICYLLTGNMVFFILACFHLLLLAVFMPRKANIILLLNLTAQDVQKLESPA